jgi:myo-inositol catabolism protein IolC
MHTRAAKSSDRKLYTLAFDHRETLQRKMFGIEGAPTAKQTETIRDAKRVVFEGLLAAVERGVAAERAGVLIDEQWGPEKVEEWLRRAAPVKGFIGFAIGRSIWRDAVEGYLSGSFERGQARELITDSYLHFVRVYEDHEVCP